jgi:hypothetical protein
MIIKNLFFVNQLLRNIKKHFKDIYKTDKYGAYLIDIKNLVIVIIFKKDVEYSLYLENGYINAISNYINQEFNKKVEGVLPKTIFISDEYIQKKYNGNYWMYYKTLE